MVGQQVYLNTQDTVYEVLTKTPEQVLCKRADAVKIDMMIKQSLTAEPDPQYNVRLVPYLNVATDTVIDPNSTKNYSRPIALAIAFIANDRSDWTRFIPVGIKARELTAKKRREAEIVSRQSEPFKPKQRLTDDSDSEEFQLCDNASKNSDSGGDSDSDSENGHADDNYNSDDDVDDKVSVYNKVTKKFEPATPKERREFISHIGAGMFALPAPLSATMVEAAEQASAARDGTANDGTANNSVIGASRLTERKSANAGESSGATAKLNNLAENERAADALYERVARLQKEREREIDSTLPSDRIRRQAASLSDPKCEPILSELAQCHHANVNDAAKFDVAQQRQATRDKDCGIVDDSGTSNETKNVLDRFAPAKSAVKQPTNAPSLAPTGSAPTAAALAAGAATATTPAVAATAPPKYTIQQLMQYGAQTKLPPSIQQQLDRNKALQKGGDETTPAQNVAALAEHSQQQQPVPQQRAIDNSRLIGEKCKAIRRKQLELMQLHAELEDLLKLPL